MFEVAGRVWDTRFVDSFCMVRDCWMTMQLEGVTGKLPLCAIECSLKAPGGQSCLVVEGLLGK